jgi:hypothetical protein
MKKPMPRKQVLDGFNERSIEFEGESIRGTVGLEVVLKELIG